MPEIRTPALTRMSIRRAFLISLGLVYLIFVAAFGYQTRVFHANAIGSTAYRDLSLAQTHTTDMAQLENHLHEVELSMLNLLLQTEQGQAPDIMWTLVETHQQILQMFAVLLHETDNRPAINVPLRQAHGLYIEFATTRDNQIIPLIASGEYAAARSLVDGIQRQRRQEFVAALQQAEVAAGQRLAEVESGIARAIQTTNRHLILVAIGIFLISLALVSWLWQSIHHPLTRILAAMSRFAEGATEARYTRASSRSHNELDFIGLRFNDLAERIQEQIRIIRESQDRIQAMFDASPNAIILCDADGRILQSNPAFVSMFGYRSAEMQGEHIAALLPEARLQAGGGLVVTRRIGGTASEMRAVNKYGATFDAEVSLSPVAIDHQQHILVEVSDISTRKRLEQDNLAQTERLRTQKEHLDLTVEKLMASNEQLERFAYVCSHDMQEPLRMVESFGQLLAMTLADKLDADQKKYFGFMTDGAKRARQMIRDILEFSRLNQTCGQLEEVDMNAICTEVSQTLNLFLQEKSARFSWDENLPSILGTSSQIYSLILNLVNNGVKFNKSAAPKVRLSHCIEGDTVCFNIDDNGIGIDEQFRQKIFNIFERLHSKSEYPGTGIGLASCKKIVDQHNGAIYVRDAPSGGARFSVHLPRIQLQGTAA